MTPAEHLATIRVQNDEESPTFAMRGDSWYCDLCDQVINEGEDHLAACERGQIRWLLTLLARQQAVVEAAIKLHIPWLRASAETYRMSTTWSGPEDAEVLEDLIAALITYQQDGGA